MTVWLGILIDTWHVSGEIGIWIRNSAEIREFTSTSNSKKSAAIFSFNETHVVLVDLEGNPLTVSRDQLSDDDNQYIESFMKRAEK